MSTTASRRRPRGLALAARLRHGVGRPVRLVIVGLVLLVCGVALVAPALSVTDRVVSAPAAPVLSGPSAAARTVTPATAPAAITPAARPAAPASTPAPAPAPVASVAAPTAATATGGDITTVRLHYGDTLWALAHRYATTVAALQALNHLGESTLIYADTDFHVPAGPAGSTAPAAPAVAPEPAPAATAPHPVGTSGHGSGPAPTTHPVPAAVPTAGSVQQIAAGMFGPQYGCAANIITRESNWNPHATNPTSGAYGLAQALPGSKMAAAGPDWATNPATQLAWMRDYVDSRYGGACAAWAFWQAHHWY